MDTYSNDLPETVSCVDGTVSVLYAETGLIKIQSTCCFFRLADCWNCESQLRVGSSVQVNARLCPSTSRIPSVPYICSSLWTSGACLPSALALRVLSAPSAREVAQYKATVPGLQLFLSDDHFEGPHQPLFPFEELSSRIESQLAANIEELEDKKKKKKKRKKSLDEEPPVKHLDFLHKINDVIAELEKDVPEVVAKVRQDETEKEWGTSYPTPAEYNAAASASTAQNNQTLPVSSSWLGLAVAPGCQPTQIQSLQRSTSEDIYDPEHTKWASEDDEKAETEASSAKKSIFTDIFEEPTESTATSVKVSTQLKASGSKGVGLADLMKDRLNRMSETKSEVPKMSDGEVRSTSNDDEHNGREKSKKKKNKIKHKKRSLSRLKTTKYCSDEVSLSSSPQKKKKSKHKKHKNKNAHSRSRSRTKSTKKKKKARSRSRKSKKRKRSHNSGCDRSASRSISRSRSKERTKKNKRSRSASLSQSNMSRCVAAQSESPPRESRSTSRRPSSRSNSRQPSSQLTTDKPLRSMSKSLRLSRSKTREASPLSKIEERSSEVSDDDEEEDEETIVAKRRLNRLKLLAKFKEKDAGESVAEEAQKEDYEDVAQPPIWPPPPPPLESEKIPISFFDQSGQDNVEEEPVVEKRKVTISQPATSTVTPVIVTFDTEILVDGSKSHLTQLGAFAWRTQPTLQPLSFFRYILVDLVKERDMLTPGSRSQLMDSFRLKTSNFDVTRSGAKQVLFKHPANGKVKVTKEKTALVDFLAYLKSLNVPVILVPHSKAAVLPVLLSLLTEHSLLDQFTALVAHICDLVSLAWGLRLDQLWVGKKHPGLREIASNLCPDLNLEEGTMPADRTASIMWTIIDRVKSKDPSLGLLAQAGGQTVVEYLTTKYSLIQAARGESSHRPAHVELGLGSEQWGRKERLDLVWQKNNLERATDHILQMMRESEHDRRTPVPVPDDEEEETVRIIRSKHSEIKPTKDTTLSSTKDAGLKMTKAESDVKLYNAFLPPGVIHLGSGGSATALLKVPGLKPRVKEVLHRLVSIEQKEEFTLATIASCSSELIQPKDSMFPAVEIILTNPGNQDVDLNSKSSKMSLYPPGEEPSIDEDLPEEIIPENSKDCAGNSSWDKRLNQTVKAGPAYRGSAFDKQDSIRVFTTKVEKGINNITCNLCEVTFQGHLYQHISGRKHKAKFSNKTYILDGEIELPEPVIAIKKNPQLNTQYLSRASESSSLQNYITKHKGKPVIGIEYLIEINGTADCELIVCLLCSIEMKLFEVIKHITSNEHRMLYLRSFFPTVDRQLAHVPNTRYWEVQTFSFIESIIQRIETKYGRMEPWVVKSKENLVKNIKQIKSTVEGVDHMHETIGFNFRAAQNPFSSYIHKIPKSEIINLSKIPLPTIKPGIDINEPYNIRTEVDKEKSDVLNKIALLRQEISTDNKYVKNAIKYRHDVTYRRKQVESNTEDISDEEFTGDLRVRKPEKRGLRSRNPDGIDSRRDRHLEREQVDQEKNNTQREKSRHKNENNDRQTRRSRSRSRERKRRTSNKSRSPERFTQEGRSVSPYTSAITKWQMFRQEERVMMAEIANRKTIFDKTPEDHPKYGEEWRKFWEKRYKELQDQGRDANNHDYKSEWIPFWTKRVVKLFDIEILEKSKDLMKKYQLSYIVEPKREDFPGGSRQRQRSVSPRRKRSPERKDHRPEKRNPSPPASNFRSRHGIMEEKGLSGPHRLASNTSLYSGISELEEKRDQGPRNEDVLRLEEIQMGQVRVVPCLRLLSALEDILGSLGPAINQALGRAIALEQEREGASGVLLEDPDTVSLINMAKEKLSGLMVARLLEGSKEGAVRVCLDNLARLLQNATKKRSSNPCSLLGSTTSPVKPTNNDNPQFNSNRKTNHESDALYLIARSVAVALIDAGKDNISDKHLMNIVEQLLRETAQVDSDPIIRKVAKDYIDKIDTKPCDVGTKNNTFTSYGICKNGRDLDDLTLEELRSLLASFKNLEKHEQVRMIDYMRKLEENNPEKVRKLKDGLPMLYGANNRTGSDNSNSQNKQSLSNDQKGNDDWSPIHKRSRRLSGSSLDMNPSGPTFGQNIPSQSSRGWEEEGSSRDKRPTMGWEDEDEDEGPRPRRHRYEESNVEDDRQSRPLLRFGWRDGR